MHTLLRHSIVKYAVVGLLGTALHFALLAALVEWAGVHPVVGSVLGFTVVLAVSYVLNKKWTFQDTGDVDRQSNRTAEYRQFIRYCMVSGSGLILNTLIMYGAVELVDLPYLLGQVIVTFVVPVQNYLFNRYWTFRRSGPA
ncbi:GtrA family protein [Paenibacillus nasutitermitis]|uniref:Cell wall teichoic acid glycosylation protein GtcA n=1 Tax=Paenibacillus nasutitermitis TaxID=1652958 RepID=A0A916ZG39_9BACL|nr:GtrA family protein [Paenibacillus nasutitermitis]GGD94467.1 cell wall teichoic acid glycosylation protein GtcA [Paenibacillus nasutitermitis]